MLDSIIGQIPGFITGLIIAFFTHYLRNKNKPKLKRKTYTTTKTIRQIKELFKQIHLQLSLENTLLIEPLLPPGQPFSRLHSHTPNGYFAYLEANKIANYSFRFWDKNDKSRHIEVEIEGIKLTIESYFAPWDNNKLDKMLSKSL